MLKNYFFFKNIFVGMYLSCNLCIYSIFVNILNIFSSRYILGEGSVMFPIHSYLFQSLLPYNLKLRETEMRDRELKGGTEIIQTAKTHKESSLLCWSQSLILRGCHCSHSWAQATSHIWQIWFTAALFLVAEFTSLPGGKRNIFHAANWHL